MKISKLIASLQELKDKYGEIEVDAACEAGSLPIYSVEAEPKAAPTSVFINVPCCATYR